MSSEREKLREVLEKGRSFVIVSHIRPDGDAYGSSLGLALSLQAAGNNVIVYNEDGLDPNFAFLPGSEMVHKTPLEPIADDYVVIVVDTADLTRTGAVFLSWNRTPDVNIDHHLSNPLFGRVNIVEPDLPATAELLFHLIGELGLPITADVASNLYVGLMTDTGCFRFRQTTARTLAVASTLVEAGASPCDLSQACYQSFPPSRLLLLGEVLRATQFSDHDRIAWFVLTEDLFARSGAARGDTEGLIEHLQSVATVEVAFLIEVLDDGTVRGSMRSRGIVDVREICAAVGGGGHRLAAGFRTNRPVAEVEAQVLRLISSKLP